LYTFFKAAKFELEFKRIFKDAVEALITCNHETYDISFCVT